MHSIVRNVFRSSALKSWAASQSNSMIMSTNALRTFSHMSKRLAAPTTVSTKHTIGCTCGCNVKFIHTKGERELVEFLNEEITAEKPSMKKIPTELDGFQIKFDGADIELTKKTDKESIVVSLCVNHSVDADEDAEDIAQDAAGKEAAIMRSKPNFDVDITKGDTTLCLSCSYLKSPPVENEYDDVFGIEELTIYKGKLSDNSYSCAGDVLDGYLYDLLMNLLEEKGVTNEFVYKLSDLSTAFEHKSYVELLEGLSKFTSGK